MASSLTRRDQGSQPAGYVQHTCAKGTTYTTILGAREREFDARTGSSRDFEVQKAFAITKRQLDVEARSHISCGHTPANFIKIELLFLLSDIYLVSPS